MYIECGKKFYIMDSGGGVRFFANVLTRMGRMVEEVSVYESRIQGI